MWVKKRFARSGFFCGDCDHCQVLRGKCPNFSVVGFRSFVNLSEFMAVDGKLCGCYYV